MARERLQPGDLVIVLPRRVAGMGEDLVLLRTGHTPTEVIRVEGEDPQLLCMFLRRERIDMSLDRATLPIVLYDGFEYTVLIGKIRLCK